MIISAVIIAKNEEKNIERAIRSLKFCSEIIVIDDESTDKTVEIAKRNNAVIIIHPLQNNFSQQRNYALKMAKGDWVLFVDADEEVSKDLQEEITGALKQKTQEAEITAYYLKRRDFFWGREMKYGEIAKTRNLGLIRLVKKNTGSWLGAVHESFTPTGSTNILRGFLNHYPHQTIKEFLGDINTYSTLRARELYDNKVHASIFQIVLYPLFKFKLNYFLYLGFLDKEEGFIYAFFMSFHSFLVRAKLYQYWHHIQ